MKIFTITLASFGLPQLYPSDVRNFIVNFLDYTEIGTEGSHHKFKKPGNTNFGCSFNEDGEIKANSGFGLAIKQIGVSIPLFNKYWSNRKEWLKKARINRDITLNEFFENSDSEQKPSQSPPPSNTDTTKNIEKLNKLIAQVPYVKRYFQSILPQMSQDDAYTNLYQFVINTQSLKEIYLKL